MIHPLPHRGVARLPSPVRVPPPRAGLSVARQFEPDAGAATGAAAIPEEALGDLRRIAEPASGFVDAMAAHLLRRLPELDRRTVAGSAFGETRACCQAHVEIIVRAVSEGETTATIALPDAAIEHARSLIRRGVTLDVLLRTYHIGQAFLSARAATLFDETIEDPEVRLGATGAIDAFLFEYIDSVSEAMVAIYVDERDSWHRSPEAVRAEALDAIMGRRGIDESRLERRLGYALTGHHMAFVLVPERRDCGYERLRDEAHLIAEALGAGVPLVVPGAGAAAWAWCRTIDDCTEAASRLHAEWQPSAPVRIAFADPAPGIDGFRASHLEALQVLEFVGRFPGAASPRGTTSYRSIEMVSLLTQDLERAARFVRSRLGALAGPDPRLRELRTTALGFLRHHQSHARASETLFLHKNTIFTRIKRVEKLLGLRSDAWGIELEAALLLAEILDEEPGIDSAESSAPSCGR